ncbi:protein phosphatase 1 regulatory subunit 32 isoform X2 [Dromiciops gliroides]|nr:protein phosphatase 1 regulatory subunit 32 isoform X2 [Dromiciops gliroides]XP_043825595.1 protein phosphatase 1 regulatory subunit 32 isoform X2 [Dromiciops gliroides]
MMGKLPLGVVSPYVKMSSGGCADPLKFYATSYCTAYSREGFKPQIGQHKGTGYQVNYRPMINYQPSLDALDNPAAGEQVKDTDQSVFAQSYRPMELSDGRHPLPWSVYQPGSGYAREKAYSCPPSKEVKRVHFNTQDHGPQVVSGLEPKTVPVLHQSVGKGSTDMENYRYGPRFMTSEYASKYRYEVPAPPDFLQKKTIGAKEESGFTEQTTKSPLTFQPIPGEPLPPPSRSTTRSDFSPMTTPHGDEYLPVLAKCSERETGFSRLKEKVLPPTTGPPSIPEPGSLSHRQYQGMQWAPKTTNAMLGRETMGCKEPSGFSTNNPGYNRGPPDPDHRFLTTYNQRYFENIPKGLDREGWTRGGIQPQHPGGYGVNQPVTQHNIESYHNPTETIQTSHPHVARTLTALDPFYRETPHSQGFSALHAPS